jgi:hypothetical protein
MGITICEQYVRAIANNKFGVLQIGAIVGTAIFQGQDLDDVDASGATIAGSDLYWRCKLECHDRPVANLGLDKQAEGACIICLECPSHKGTCFD